MRLASLCVRQCPLIHERYQLGGRTNTPHRHAVSVIRGGSCHREFNGEGRNLLPFRSKSHPHPHQEAVAFAALVKDQLQYQVLPLARIPVPKSLVIPVGMCSISSQGGGLQDINIH